MNNFKSLLSLLVVVIISTPAYGEKPDPEVLAMQYYEAMKNEGMTTIGRFMHPNALIDFKAMLLPIYKSEAASGKRHLMDLTFGESANIADLKKIEPENFMNGFMNLVAAKTGDIKINFDKLEVLGTVTEGKAKHVLARMTIGSGELALTEFEVLSFIPYKREWRLLLNGKYKGLAQTLQTGMEKNNQ